MNLPANSQTPGRRKLLLPGCGQTRTAGVCPRDCFRWWPHTFSVTQSYSESAFGKAGIASLVGTGAQETAGGVDAAAGAPTLPPHDPPPPCPGPTCRADPRRPRGNAAQLLTYLGENGWSGHGPGLRVGGGMGRVLGSGGQSSLPRRQPAGRVINRLQGCGRRRGGGGAALGEKESEPRRRPSRRVSAGGSPELRGRKARGRGACSLGGGGGRATGDSRGRGTVGRSEAGAVTMGMGEAPMAAARWPGSLRQAGREGFFPAGRLPARPSHCGADLKRQPAGQGARNRLPERRRREDCVAAFLLKGKPCPSRALGTHIPARTLILEGSPPSSP